MSEMDKEGKEYLIKVMESFKKGRIGLLAVELERVIISVPAPRIAVLMALEMLVEAEARMAERGDHPSPSASRKKAHDVADLVREHFRGMTEEHFDSFTSDESIDEVLNEAQEAMREMMMAAASDDHSCGGCGNCENPEGSEEPEDPDPMLN